MRNPPAIKRDHEGHGHDIDAEATFAEIAEAFGVHRVTARSVYLVALRACWRGGVSQHPTRAARVARERGIANG